MTSRGDYKSHPFTEDECRMWLQNKTINPRTKRPIQIGKGIYNILERECTNPPETEETLESIDAKIKIMKQRIATIDERAKLIDAQLSKLYHLPKQSPKQSPKRESAERSPKRESAERSPKKEQKMEELEKNEITRPEVYNYFKREYSQYSGISGSDKFREPTKHDILNLYIRPDVKVHYISSLKKIDGEDAFSDGFGLRDWIQLNIKNYTGRAFQKPKYVPNRGWMYYNNDYNMKNMIRVQRAINLTNQHFKGYKIVEETSPLSQGIINKYGIIGWDVPFEEPQWLKNLTGDRWTTKYNPRYLYPGYYEFLKCTMTNVDVEKAIKLLQSRATDDKSTWNQLYHIMIYFKGGPKLAKGQSDLKNFLNDDQYRSCVIGWGKHARYAYKDVDNKHLIVFDPWKKSASGKSWRLVVSAAVENGYNAIFVPRDARDQGGEGSCAAVALMRAIFITENGLKGATIDVPPEYAVLTQRILSISRGPRK